MNKINHMFALIEFIVEGEWEGAGPRDLLGIRI